MKDAFYITKLGGQILGAILGSPIQLSRFAAGRSKDAGDRMNVGLLDPTPYAGPVLYYTYLSETSRVVNMRIPSNAVLTSGTEFYEFALLADDGSTIAVAELTTPVIFEAGHDCNIEVPLHLTLADAEKIDALTTAELAHLPATSLDNLRSPAEVNASAVLVTGIKHSNLERPVLAFKHGTGSSRWAFSDHIIAGQFTAGLNGDSLTEIPLAFDLYPNEYLLMFVAVGPGYGSTRQVKYVVEADGSRKLVVVGNPIKLGRNSLCVLHRHVANVIPPTVGVPADYVLKTARQQTTARAPNQLRLRFRTEWLQPGAASLTLADYSLDASRDYQDAHLVFRAGKLVEKGSYAFANNRLAFNTAVDVRTPVMLGIFESVDSDQPKRLTLNVVANQASVTEVATYDGMLTGDDAVMLFASDGQADASNRLFDDSGKFAFEQPPQADYLLLTQEHSDGVQSYTSPRVVWGIVPESRTVTLPTEPVGFAGFVDGQLSRDVAYSGTAVSFTPEQVGKAYALLTVNTDYAEASVQTSNLQWADPAGATVRQGVSVKVLELGFLAAGQTTTVPAADALLVFCGGAKLPVEDYAYLPHKEQFRARRAGVYTVVAVKRDPTSSATTKLRKHYFVTATAGNVVPANPGSAFLLFVGNWQQPAQDYTVVRNTGDVKVTVNDTHLPPGMGACLVEFYTDELVGNEGGFCIQRRFTERDYLPLNEPIAKDNLLVFANAVFVPDADYEISFFESSAVLDVALDYHDGYLTEVFGLHADTKSIAVNWYDFERLTNTVNFH